MADQGLAPSTLENLHDAFVLIDRTWHFTCVNQGASRIFSRESSEYVGKLLWDAFPVLSGSPEGEVLRRTMDRGEFARLEIQGTETGRWFNVFVAPSADGIAAYWHDVTEWKDSGIRLQEAKLSAEREERIAYLSFHDVLTGLYNRRYMEEEIRRLDTPRNLPISVIEGDVNRLKLVNDAFGHERGDELLRIAADTLRASCRPEDLVARWGGDEFMVFLPRTSREDAEKIVARIRANAAVREVQSIPVSISLGVGTKTSSDQTILSVVIAADDAMYQVKSKESERSRRQMVDTIVGMFYSKYPYEESHAKRVGQLCERTAEALGYGPERVKKVALAGLMHDIGKVGVGIEIIGKPGDLNEEEWVKVRRHSEMGYRIVGSAEEMIEVGNAILAHHERVDGTGYPSGTRREEIPEAARIIAVVDGFATMTGPSPYRRPMKKEAAVAEIRRNEGTQFDREIAEVFIEKVLCKEVSG